jgi:acyl-CoA reductase-like NAD-dependent aldehyde dehydrogenase
MGGSSPAIVFDDVNVDEVIDGIYSGRYFNCGQVCDALKRLIVHKSIFDELVEKLKDKVESKIIGDPEDKNTDIGSLVSKKQLETLEFQVDDAVKKGVKIIAGGKKPNNLKGAYYLPTILTNVKTNMKIWREEVFGPVLPIISFAKEDEAVKLANDTQYGLGSHVYSNDKKHALEIASKIQAGTVEINNGNRWLECNPFGGYKESSMGREHGSYGLRELCQIKVISMSK